MFLSSVLSEFVDELFPGMQVMGSYQFRVTRNSELVVDEEEVENLALALRDELVTRGYRPAVRLEIAHDCPAPILRTLLQNFGLNENAVYRITGPVNLSRVTQVYDLVQRPELKYPSFNPRTLRDSEGIFEIVKKAMCCCITPSMRLPRCWMSSARPQSTRTCWRSSRRCIAPARIR